MSFRSTLALVAGLLAAAPLGAATLTLELDPDRTAVALRLGATLHTVHGSLGPAAGRIAFDPETGQAEGEVVVDLTAASTDNGRRDRKMHERILETALFPRAVFQVERIDIPQALRQGGNDLQLHGTLTFHGASRPFALPVMADLAGDQVTATSELEVPYVDWGLRDPSFFMLRVAKAVVVQIRAVGRLSGTLPGEGPAPAVVAESPPP
jgi:polyisoprenoid-binding protein YceI